MIDIGGELWAAMVDTYGEPALHFLGHELYNNFTPPPHNYNIEQWLQKEAK